MFPRIVDGPGLWRVKSIEKDAIKRVVVTSINRSDLSST